MMNRELGKAGTGMAKEWLFVWPRPGMSHAEKTALNHAFYRLSFGAFGSVLYSNNLGLWVMVCGGVGDAGWGDTGKVIGGRSPSTTDFIPAFNHLTGTSGQKYV